MTMVYESLRNVVIKFGPADYEPAHSVLINTHFDTVPVSPGAGDAGIMVVAMLEMLRVLAKSPDTLEHSLVFLMNGAEENSLQGAHAFIAHHKWAGRVRAFVNLDSSGNGGREVMFQASSDGPWLTEVEMLFSS
jgi:Zn-dependent M28 family amino/carboxypeptidase